MKRISLWLVAVWLSAGGLARAQDAAVEERLNKLSGQVEDLLAAKAEQDKRIAALLKELEGLREQSGKPNAQYASAEDVRKLAESVKEIDRKRVEDNERIVTEIEKLVKLSAGGAKNDSRPPDKKKDSTIVVPGKNAATSGTGGNEHGFEHVIASGDTLSTIVEAYRAKGVKVTLDQILKANPDLKERSLQVGRKIFIPAPQ